MKQTLALIISASLLWGCATTKDFYNTLGPPAQIQTDVKNLGAVALPRIKSDQAKAAIHQFALDMINLADLDASKLIALIPRTGDPAADALIAAGVSFVQSAIAKVGAHNPTGLAYPRAIGNGLLQAGF
jgi:hypothetical protein